MSTCAPEQAVKSKIDACRSQNDTWKSDQELAVCLFKTLDGLIADMTESYDVIQRLDSWCRSEIQRAPNTNVQLLSKLEAGIKDLWISWLDVAENVELTTQELRYHIDLEFAKRLADARQNRDHDFELEARKALSNVIFPPIESFQHLLRPIEEFPD